MAPLMLRAAHHSPLLVVLATLPLPAQSSDLSVTGSGPHSVVKGEEVSVRFEASGGTGAGFTWQVVEGIPSGLDLEWDNTCAAWEGFEPAGAVDGSLAPPRLRAVSGIAASWLQPGVLWAHDDADSGLPLLYAIDEDGTHVQTFELDGEHHDWEDIALGPGPGDGEMLYVGDFGDNGRTRSHAWLLRFPEPAVAGGGADPSPIEVETLYFKYPDGMRDIETLLFDWKSGTPYVIERNDAGCRAYKFPMPLDPGRDASDPVELILVTHDTLLPPTLTGGDALRDGSRIALRSYTHVYEYAREMDAAFDEIFATSPCWMAPTSTQQYEGLTYGAEGDVLLTTTERAGRDEAPILRAGAQPAASRAVLAGTPEEGGRHLIELEVRDSSGAAARVVWELDVLPLEPPSRHALPGDCDASGALDMGDASCLLGLLFANEEPATVCDTLDDEVAILDFNADTSVDISDAIGMLLFLFATGPGHGLGTECVDTLGCTSGCQGAGPK